MAKEIKFNIKLTVDGKEQIQTITADARALGKAINDAKTKVQSFGEAFLSFNQGVELVKNISDAFSYLSDNIRQTARHTRELVAFTGKSGDEMRHLRNGVEAVADYFGKDFREVLRATNALSKGFGIEMDEALKLVRGGLVSGADAGGDFLDTLREYPRYFKEAGLSAEDFIAITANAAKQGVFSDKGVDVIKEGNIRLREMTKATSDALEGIGISADSVQQQLREGSITTFEVMRQVAEKLKELPASSSQVGAAIADIFGAPGEDAGLEYITTLANVKLSLDEVKAATNGAAKQQEDQIKLQEKIKNNLSDLIDLSGVYASMAPFLDMTAKFGNTMVTIAATVGAFKALGAAQLMVIARTKLLNAAAVIWNTTSVSMNALTQTMSATLRGAAVSATTLKLAMRGLFIASGVGVAIVALTEILSQLSLSLKNAADSTSNLTKEQGEATAAEEEARAVKQRETQQIRQATSALNLNMARLKAFKGSKEEEKKLVAEMNSAYGASMGYYSSVSQWYKVLTSNSKAYCRQMVNEAKIRSATEEIAKLEEQRDSLRDAKGNVKGSKKRKTKTVNTSETYVPGFGFIYKTAEVPIAGTSEYDKNSAKVKKIDTSIASKQKQVEKLLKENGEINFEKHEGYSPTNINNRSAHATSTHTDKPKPAEEGSLDWYEDKMEALRKSIKAAADTEEAKKLQTRYEEYEKKYKDLEVEIGLKEPGEKEVKTHVEELRDKLRRAQKDFDGAIDAEAKVKADAEVSKLQAEIDEATRGQISIKADVEPSYIEKGSNDDKRISYGNARQKADRIQQDYEIGIIGKDEALRQIDELNKVVEEMGMKPIHVDVQTEDLEKARERAQDTRNALLNGWEGVKGVGDGIQNMTSALEGNANAWEKLRAVVDGTIGIIQSVSAIAGMVNALKGGVAAADAATTAAAGSSATAAAAAAAGQGAQIAVAPGVIAANKLMTASYMELASAMYFAAHASIPLMGFGIAQGFITAATAMVQAIGVMPFAKGGVVSGPTLALVGEYAGASNNPEVIAPLDKLRSMLQPRGAMPGGSVRFEIDGRTLVGVLANETRVSSRSGRRSNIII